MCEDINARILIKQGSGVPTIPASTDHRNGDWIDTDIYEGELYLDNATGILYTSNGGVIQKASKLSDNFATADLTFTGDRAHNTAGYDFELTTDAGSYAEGFLYVNTDYSGIGTFDSGFSSKVGEAAITGGTVVRLKADLDSLKLLKSIEYTYIAKTATYTITNSDYLIDCTSNTFTVTLPTAVGIDGRTYIIKNSGVGTITLDGNGTETIDGALTLSIATTKCYTVVSNGTNWIIISAY